MVLEASITAALGPQALLISVSSINKHHVQTVAKISYALCPPLLQPP